MLLELPNATPLTGAAMTNDLDKRWEDWAYALCIAVLDERSRARCELHESFANLPADQRKRSLPAVADIAWMIDENIDEAQFCKMQHGWTHPDSAAFRRRMVADLNLKPHDWKEEPK